MSIRSEREEFKPEKIPEGAHMFGAEVLEVIYMGEILRTMLRVAGSDEFVIKTRNTLGQTKLEPVRKIKVGWHPQDDRALSDIACKNDRTNQGEPQMRVSYVSIKSKLKGVRT